MKALALAIFLGISSIFGIAQDSPDQDAIKALRVASNKAIAAGDIVGFSVSLDHDFVVVTGNGSFLSRDAYIAAFRKDFEDPRSVRFERMIDSIEISGSVPLAAEHGHWVGRLPGGAVIFSGTYLAMWRNSASHWKLRSELFVSLACMDVAECESYRKRYGGTTTPPGN
ncbi:nuclear transport factor 2 family protein [Telmatobacter sp. DSM 110680]|uniref:Nuclear transport factor 2 family protein n=1 Tax=Telmatobacter sp. DSM 110680 TaxID=3036704 RepID=A0AAU7DFN7_9BACT